MRTLQQEIDDATRGSLRVDPNREPTQKEIFDFLDGLRASGKTNMVGATPYLTHYFDLPEKTAKEHHRAWLGQYKKRAELYKLITS